MLRKVILLFMIAVCVATCNSYINAEETNKILYSNSFEFGTTGISKSDKSYNGASFYTGVTDNKNVLIINGGINKSERQRNINLFLYDNPQKYYGIDVNLRQHAYKNGIVSILFGYKSDTDYYSLSIDNSNVVKLCKGSLTSPINSECQYTLTGNSKITNWKDIKIDVTENGVYVSLNDDEIKEIEFKSKDLDLSGKMGIALSGTLYSPIECYIDNFTVFDAKEYFDAHLEDSVAFLIGSSNYLKNSKKMRLDILDPYVKIYMDNGISMVPLRIISELMGFEIGYDEGAIMLNDRNRRIILHVGSNKCEFNGETHILSRNVMAVAGRSYVPLREISQIFNKNVKWYENGLIIVGENVPELSEYSKKQISYALGKSLY